MTYCLGIKVEGGLVGIADTRILSGNETTQNRKIFTYTENGSCMFLMTSGLRSLTDKVLTYFDLEVMDSDPHYDHLYQAVNVIAGQIRRVAREDKTALLESHLEFNIHCLVGGQLQGDKDHKLYLIYPQGNWIEIEEGSPYQSVGARAYSKALLDRALTYNDSMSYALKIAFLAFNSTRISAVDVDFPLDVVLYARDSFQIIEHRLEEKDLHEAQEWWNNDFRESVRNLTSAWMEPVLAKLNLPETS